MVMNNIDLSELSNKIWQKVMREVTEAYHNGNIEEVIKKYELEDNVESQSFYYERNIARIIVIGDSRVSKNDLEKVVKHNGIDPRRVEFVFEYEKFTNFNYGKFRNNMNYSDVLVGPIPHKGKNIDDSSSFLAMVKKDPKSFPRVIDIRNTNELKITKSAFLKGLLKTRMYEDLYK